ncbi:MAG: hypothetical protein JST36_01530 [Bacteroidetes bacterium]|nr:hypothetical protein [Bacteroidota bacterium]
MDPLNLLHDRLSDLIASYKSLQQALRASEAQLAIAEQTNLNLQRELAATEAQLLALQVNAAFPDKEMKAQTRQKLDNIIADIDNLLNNIHED